MSSLHRCNFSIEKNGAISHYWGPRSLHQRVYLAVSYSVVKFCFSNIVLFYVRKVYHKWQFLLLAYLCSIATNAAVCVTYGN
jgi:hypothetical protein